eukprot:443595-Rhodomonas_salina.2
MPKPPDIRYLSTAQRVAAYSTSVPHSATAHRVAAYATSVPQCPQHYALPPIAPHTISTVSTGHCIGEAYVVRPISTGHRIGGA